MKFAFSGILFFVQSFLVSQTLVNLPDLKMEYQLPSGWENKSFFKYDFESASGTDICSCAASYAAFKIPGSTPNETIEIIIYPSDKKHINLEKRQQMWHYQFIPVSNSEKIKTEHMQWEKQISKLKETGTYKNKYQDYTAYKLYGVHENVYYLMYIIGKPLILQKYKKDIDSIIKSFKPLS